MKKNNADIFARKFEMFETVYNVEKKCLQMVLSEIPINKRSECGLPKLKRAYIVTTPGTYVWSIESGEALRPATIYERSKS